MSEPSRDTLEQPSSPAAADGQSAQLSYPLSHALIQSRRHPHVSMYSELGAFVVIRAYTTSIPGLPAESARYTPADCTARLRCSSRCAVMATKRVKD